MKKGLGRNPGSCRRWISGQRGKGFLIQKSVEGDFPGGPVAKALGSQCRGPGSIPDQGMSFHMLQLRPHTVKDINTFFKNQWRQTVTMEVKARFGISLVLSLPWTS